jgi:hypothetical protein
VTEILCAVNDDKAHLARRSNRALNPLNWQSDAQTVHRGQEQSITTVFRIFSVDAVNDFVFTHVATKQVIAQGNVCNSATRPRTFSGQNAMIIRPAEIRDENVPTRPTEQHGGKLHKLRGSPREQHGEPSLDFRETAEGLFKRSHASPIGKPAIPHLHRRRTGTHSMLEESVELDRAPGFAG